MLSWEIYTEKSTREGMECVCVCGGGGGNANSTTVSDIPALSTFCSHLTV